MKHRLPTTAAAIVAALTLSGSVVTASTPAQPADHSAADHAAARCGANESSTTEAAMPAKPNKGKADQSHGKSDQSHGNAHTQQQGDAEEQTDHERPQNHGWYVSQAAHDQSATGRDHGQAVADVARGDAGKPEAADK
jgi:hypothetical protein